MRISPRLVPTSGPICGAFPAPGPQTAETLGGSLERNDPVLETNIQSDNMLLARWNLKGGWTIGSSRERFGQTGMMQLDDESLGGDLLEGPYRRPDIGDLLPLSKREPYPREALEGRFTEARVWMEQPTCASTRVLE